MNSADYDVVTGSPPQPQKNQFRPVPEQHADDAEKSPEQNSGESD